MLRVSYSDQLNDEYIEAICIYGSDPLVRFASKARHEDRLRTLKGKYGLRTLIVMEEGRHFLCPFLPKTYMSKLDDREFFIIDPNRYMIIKKDVLEITSRLNTEQRREVQKEKETGKFISLSRKQATTQYLFMKSGRIYGIHTVRPL